MARAELSGQSRRTGGCGARRLVLLAYAVYLGCRAQRRCRNPIQPADRRDRRQLRRHHRARRTSPSCWLAKRGTVAGAYWRDLAYLSIGADGTTPGVLFSGVETDADTFIGTLGLTYRLIHRTDRWLDLVAGGRFWSVDNDVTFKAGRLPEVKTGVSESWVDPVVGLRGEHRSRLGFRRSRLRRCRQRRIGPDLADLRSDRLPVQRSCPGAIGYRYLSVDYEDNGFVWDVAMSGPIIGLSIRF